MIDIKNTLIAFDYEGPEIEEIVRNLTTLYGTIAGTVPLDRNFGLSKECISYPIPVAENMIALEITEKTELYEPRVEVEEVTFTSSLDGVLIPKVVLTRSNRIDTEGD